MARHGRGLRREAVRPRRPCPCSSCRPHRVGVLRRRRLRHGRDGTPRNGRGGRRGGSRRRLVARARRAPATRPCRLRGGRCRDRSRRLDGPQHLVVDRRRPLLGRSRERHRHARVRRRRPRRRRASRPAVAIARSPARRGARRSPRLGPARQGDPGARPRRCRQRRAPEGIDRLLERPRAPRGRGARARPLARSSRSASASAGREAPCCSTRPRS